MIDVILIRSIRKLADIAQKITNSIQIEFKTTLSNEINEYKTCLLI